MRHGDLLLCGIEGLDDPKPKYNPHELWGFEIDLFKEKKAVIASMGSSIAIFSFLVFLPFTPTYPIVLLWPGLFYFSLPYIAEWQCVVDMEALANGIPGEIAQVNNRVAINGLLQAAPTADAHGGSAPANALRNVTAQLKALAAPTALPTVVENALRNVTAQVTAPAAPTALTTVTAQVTAPTTADVHGVTSTSAATADAPRGSSSRTDAAP